jgi:hypothetical protein
MKTYSFVIKLAGEVEAESYDQAEAKLNAHLSELGKVDSWDLELDSESLDV